MSNTHLLEQIKLFAYQNDNRKWNTHKKTMKISRMVI